jgi:hypothetical protein
VVLHCFSGGQLSVAHHGEIKMFIEIARREHLNTQRLDEMHQLRAHIFKDIKKWDVCVIDNKEIDEYDSLNPYYLLISKNPEDEVIGCWRILDTVGPSMLKDTFHELLHGKPAPQDTQTLERDILGHNVASNQGGRQIFVKSASPSVAHSDHRRR